TARVAAARGHRVTVVERAAHAGGVARIAGPGELFTKWLQAEVEVAGVTVQLDSEFTGDTSGALVVQCTGGQPGRREYEIADGAVVIDIVELRRGAVNLPEGTIAVFDPIGGPIAVALAEELAERAVLITQDHIAGNELS
ncbi:unnamed protein product, partial [Phaeothamnion confervicola]